MGRLQCPSRAARGRELRSSRGLGAEPGWHCGAVSACGLSPGEIADGYVRLTAISSLQHGMEQCPFTTIPGLSWHTEMLEGTVKVSPRGVLLRGGLISPQVSLHPRGADWCLWKLSVVRGGTKSMQIVPQLGDSEGRHHRAACSGRVTEGSHSPAPPCTLPPGRVPELPLQAALKFASPQLLLESKRVWKTHQVGRSGFRAGEPWEAWR